MTQYNQGRGTNHGRYRVLTPYISGSTKLRGAGPGSSGVTAMDADDHCYFTGSPSNPDQSAVGHRIWEALDNTDLVIIRFYMVMSDGSDPNNKTGSAFFSLAREGVNHGKLDPAEYVGDPGCSVTLICGNKAVPSGVAMLPPNAKWVDTITEVADYTEGPGLTITNVADAAARMRFGIEGAAYLIGQVTGDSGTPHSRVGAILYPL